MPDVLDGTDDRQQRAIGLGDVVDERVGVQVERRTPRTARARDGAPTRQSMRHERDCARSIDAQVLEDGELAQEPEVLVDEAQPQRGELARRQRQRHRLAVDLQLALVGRVEAGQDLDERRLARAVLAEQAVDLAAVDRQVDVVERPRTAEGLRQSAQRDDRRAAGPGGRPRRGARLRIGGPGPVRVCCVPVRHVLSSHPRASCSR